MKAFSSRSVIGLLMCVSQLVGCGSAKNSDQMQGQVMTDQSNATTLPLTNALGPRESSRVVPPGMGGDFSFVCPDEGLTTIAISGNCEKQITLISLEWATEAEKVNAAPGLKDALDRKDDAAVMRIIDEQFGDNSPVAKIYFTDADVNVNFDAPLDALNETFIS